MISLRGVASLAAFLVLLVLLFCAPIFWNLLIVDPGAPHDLQVTAVQVVNANDPAVLRDLGSQPISRLLKISVRSRVDFEAFAAGHKFNVQSIVDTCSEHGNSVEANPSLFDAHGAVTSDGVYYRGTIEAVQRPATSGLAARTGTFAYHLYVFDLTPQAICFFVLDLQDGPWGGGFRTNTVTVSRDMIAAAVRGAAP